MRRIRFKARSLKTGEMVEGFYAHLHIANFDADGMLIAGYKETDAIFNNEPGSRKGGYWVDIDPETLCQQTGMDDIFMFPIWEHDIVALHSLPGQSEKEPGEVVFLQTAYAVRFDDGSNELLSTLRKRYDIQVIGNAFE